MENENPRRLEVDSKTVQRALEGNQSALAQIYDTYAKPIYRYHFSRVDNAPDAEDLTAQTFLAPTTLRRRQRRSSPIATRRPRVPDP